MSDFRTKGYYEVSLSNGEVVIDKSFQSDIYGIADANDDGILTPGESYEFGLAVVEGYVSYGGVDYPVVDYHGSTLLYVPNHPNGDTQIEEGVALGTLSTNDLPLCFCDDCYIMLASGKTKSVSEVVIGDELLLADNGFCKVIWIGIQKKNFIWGVPERLQPIRIRAGALGNNIPESDMTVSNDHALLVDGILANAGALVNETSIFRVPVSEFPDMMITYYHIETENHEIIYANGTPTETFIDNVSRSTFDNYQEYVDLYGEDREMDELPMPRAMSPRQLPKSIKTRLAARAIELDYAEKAVA